MDTDIIIHEQRNMPRRSVSTIIAERLSGHPHRDHERLALVIECGGMRGVVAAGMLSILSDYDFRYVFNSFHGSSAGACAAAFFMSDQAVDGCQIYLEDICTPQFISLKRMLGGQSPVATESIVDSVIFIRRRLDASMILDECALYISSTDADTGIERIFSQFSTKDQLAGALKATLELPSLRRRGYLMDGAPCIDGGYSAPIAVRSAMAAGATHALILCTQRPQDYTESKYGLDIEGLLLGLRYGPHMTRAYRRAQEDRVAFARGNSPSELALDVIMREPRATYCSNLEIRQDILMRSMVEGEQAARKYISNLI
jgi:predicted patatin/cPLA2 family phospholipase